MNFTKIFTIFADICKTYGINILGWVVVMTTIFSIYILQEKRVDKIINYQQENYRIMLEQTISSIKYKEDQQHLSNFSFRMSNNPVVKKLLNEYRKTLDCDQIIICEYHNGFSNISTSIPFCKFSCTYEVVSDPSCQMSDFFQGINISNYNSIDDMVSNMYLIKNIEYFKNNDNNLYIYLKNKGVKMVGMCEIGYVSHRGFIIVLNYSNKSIDVNKLLNLSREIDSLLVNNVK